MDATTDVNFPNAVLTILDAHGLPAPVDGVPKWASSDETVLRVTATADGMSASVDTVAPGGPARITVTAEADLGTGTQTITGVSPDVVVGPGQKSVASVVTVTLGAAVDKTSVGVTADADKPSEGVTADADADLGTGTEEPDVVVSRER
jgi:hypothetical protein